MSFSDFLKDESSVMLAALLKYLLFFYLIFFVYVVISVVSTGAIVNASDAAIFLKEWIIYTPILLLISVIVMPLGFPFYLARYYATRIRGLNPKGLGYLHGAVVSFIPLFSFIYYAFNYISDDFLRPIIVFSMAILFIINFAYLNKGLS